MPVNRTSLFWTRDLGDAAYLRRLSEGLRFWQAAVGSGLPEGLLQNALAQIIPLWETSTILDCWAMMNEEPLIHEIITAFMRIPTNDNKNLATGGEMLKHFVEPLIENWPGSGVDLSEELVHRDLKAEWNDFVGHPSDWSHRRTPEHLVRRRHFAGINKEARGAPGAVHGPKMLAADALPNISHNASHSLPPLPARRRQQGVAGVKERIAIRQQTRQHKKSAPEKTTQHRQQNRLGGFNINAASVPSLEKYVIVVQGYPEEPEDDTDEPSREASDDDYEDAGEMDLDFDEFQAPRRISGAKTTRTRKRKRINNTEGQDMNMLSEAEKVVIAKKAKTSAKLSASMKARWSDGRMDLAMEKRSQSLLAKKAAKPAAISNGPSTAPKKKAFEWEEYTPVLAPQRKKGAAKNKEKLVAMDEAMAIAAQEDEYTRSPSDIGFASDTLAKEDDPFTEVGSAANDPDRRPNEVIPRGDSDSSSEDETSGSHAKLRKKGDRPIDDGNIDFEPAVLGIYDPSKLRISIDHERTLPDGRVVSGLPGKYSAGTRINYTYFRKVKWHKESSITKLNFWRSANSYRNFKSGWKLRPARWLQSEKDWVLAYMQANGCKKWNRLTNAYNEHFRGVVQLSGEPFINVCGDNPTLAADGQAPLRTREAIEAVTKRWEEYQTLFAGNVPTSGPVEQTATSSTGSVIFVNVTTSQGNGDGSSGGTDQQMPTNSAHAMPEIIEIESSDDDELPISEIKRVTPKKASKLSSAKPRSEPKQRRKQESLMDTGRSGMSAKGKGKQIESELEDYDDGPEYSDDFVKSILEARKRRREEGMDKNKE